MQFSGKIRQNNRLVPPPLELAPLPPVWEILAPTTVENGSFVPCNRKREFTLKHFQDEIIPILFPSHCAQKIFSWKLFSLYKMFATCRQRKTAFNFQLDTHLRNFGHKIP